MYDIVVGIPSYNEEKTIKFVTEQVALGLNKYYSDKNTLIVNVDNNSKDNTETEFFKSKTGEIKKIYISTNERGKGNNLFNFFSFVSGCGCRACAVFDADLKSINPLWVKNTIEPILNGMDFVTPMYIRDKNDGTITNHFIYPIIYGVFRKNIRQPIGGDFGFSKHFVDFLLKQKWSSEVKQYGIDVFLTTHALLNGFNVGCAYLGTKIHKEKDPKKDLGDMFHQVITTLFDMLCKNNMIPNAKSIENPVCWEEKLFNFLVEYPKSNSKEEFIKSIKQDYLDRVFSFQKETEFFTQEKAEELIRKQAKKFKEILVRHST